MNHFRKYESIYDFTQPKEKKCKDLFMIKPIDFCNQNEAVLLVKRKSQQISIMCTNDNLGPDCLELFTLT